MAGPNQYRPGVGSVGQYQMSAKPFLSSSIVVSNSAVTEIKFPAVTSFLTIQNTHAGANVPLLVGFSSRGGIRDRATKLFLTTVKVTQAILEFVMFILLALVRIAQALSSLVSPAFKANYQVQKERTTQVQ